jgi:Fe/S biogenesis protein NfuA
MQGMASTISRGIAITSDAASRVDAFRHTAPQPEGQSLLIEVTGAEGNEWLPAISLRPLAAAGPSDVVIRDGELPIVVPGRDWEKLQGSTVEWVEDAVTGGGLRLRNPNRPSPQIDVGPVPATGGSVAERVAHVLEHQINPQIAQHGGRAELVSVEEGTATLRLGGGCQGCGMAKVTLDEGIERAILSAVPEIERVVDVTDHSAGEEPYYAPSEA